MRRAKTKNETITVAKAFRLYPDEWVLMEITRQHNDYRHMWGRVLAHSPNRDDLDEPYARFRAQHPQGLTAEFFARDVVPEGVVVVL